MVRAFLGEQMKKSLTITDNLRTSVKDLQDKVFSNNLLLSALGNTALPGKFTYVPYTDVPALLSTTYVVGGLLVTKELHTLPAVITDETIEDAAIDILPALTDVLSAQLSYNLEDTVTTAIKALAVTPLVDAPTAKTAIHKLLASFIPTVFSITGTPIIAVSYNTYFDLYLDSDPITKLPGFNIVPCASLANADNDIIIMHPHGSVLGYELKELERTRAGGTGTSTINMQGTIGTAFSTSYVKRAVY